MTWEQIKQLHGQGFEIGNHTRHHTSVNAQSVAELTADIAYIEDQCEKNGIPRPVTFCYPGHATSREAVNVLKERGYKCARAGGSRVFEPGKDDPLLMPQAFSSYPGMTIEELKVAVANAREGRIAVLTFHGVPDVQHPTASTDQETFKAYMNYLKAEGCTVVALRDISITYTDANGLNPACRKWRVDGKTSSAATKSRKQCACWQGHFENGRGQEGAGDRVRDFRPISCHKRRPIRK